MSVSTAVTSCLFMIAVILIMELRDCAAWSDIIHVMSLQGPMRRQDRPRVAGSAIYTPGKERESSCDISQGGGTENPSKVNPACARGLSPSLLGTMSSFCPFFSLSSSSSLIHSSCHELLMRDGQDTFKML